MWILNASGRYRLDPALIGTDLEAFGAALEAARTRQRRRPAGRLPPAVALYRGELAEGAGYEWAEPYAETARRRALDAWTTIAEILQPADPDQALSALETALSHDPYNEYLYQRIMRLQAAAGRPEAVRRTLGLLETRLTDLGITPSSQTRQAAASLLAAGPAPGQQPRPAPGPRPWRRAARAAHRVTRREPRAARIRLDPPPAATLTSPRPGPIPPRTGQRDRPDGCGSRHLRIPAALRPE